MPIQLTIERQTRKFDSGTVGIGRGPENQFSLPDDLRLAPSHAILKPINNRWIIESRDGGPVRIGSGRPVQFAWLNSGDVIQLTEAGPELVFEVVAAPAITQPSPSEPTPSVASSSSAVRASPTVQADRSWVTKPIVIVIAIVPLFLATAWMAWPRTSRIESRRSDNPVSAVEPPMRLPTEMSSKSESLPSVVDPRERLILVGIGDLHNDNRPHVLGVGWLWNERTAVVPRLLGDFVESLIGELKSKGTVRQGCVIQGVSLEIEQILSPAECPEISILHLKKPAESPELGPEQWLRVTSDDIQRRRGQGKKIRRISFRALPHSPEVERARQESPIGSTSLGYVNGLSWRAYDPEITEFTERATEEARFVYEQGRHFLNVAGVGTRLERVGLLIDDQQKIVGMTLPDASVIWTDSLQNALGSP